MMTHPTHYNGTRVPNTGELLGAISDELAARGRPSSGQFSFSELVVLVDMARDIGAVNALDVFDAVASQPCREDQSFTGS